MKSILVILFAFALTATLAAPQSYGYKYDVDAPEYGTKFGHQETRRVDVTNGEYYVLLPDGRTQVITYNVNGPYSGAQTSVRYLY